MTDFPDWQTPQANATAISVTGVPLLTGAGSLLAFTGKSIGASGQYAGSILTVSQIGYEISVKVLANAASTNPFVEVGLFWYDAVSGIVVDEDYYFIPGSGNATKFIVVGRGPTKADQVQVVVNNLDTVNAVTVDLVLLQNSRVYANADWHWLNPTANVTSVPGFTLATMPDDESVLGILNNVTIAASTTNGYLFGMHTGLINIGYELSAGTAANLSIRIRAAPDGSYSGHNIIYSQSAPPGNFQIAGTRSPLRLLVANAATTSMTLSLSAIRADQP